MKKSILYLLPMLFVCFMFVPVVAIGETQTADITVSANLTGICSLNAGNIAFGNIPVNSSGVQFIAPTHSQIEVNCPLDVIYQIGVSNGQNYNGTYRRMLGPGSAPIIYGLTQDMSGIVLWDPTPSRNGTFTSSGGPRLHDVYAGAQIDPTLPLGSYQDIVIVTLQY